MSERDLFLYLSFVTNASTNQFNGLPKILSSLARLMPTFYLESQFPKTDQIVEHAVK